MFLIVFVTAVNDVLLYLPVAELESMLEEIADTSVPFTTNVYCAGADD